MRNLKKVMALLVAITILAVAVVPVLADETYLFESQAQILGKLGLVSGTGEQNPDGTIKFNLGKQLDRQTGVTLLIKAEGKEADVLALTEQEIAAALKKFTDKGDIDTELRAYVAYAVIHEITVGTSATTFSPKKLLNGKEFSTFILRQRGYTVDLSNFEQAGIILADKGGMSQEMGASIANKTLNQDEMYGIAYNTLFVKGTDGKTLAQKLVDNGFLTNDDLKTNLPATDYAKTEVVPIKSVAAVPDVSIDMGENPPLPETVSVTYSDDTTDEVSVTWDLTSVDNTKPGTYKVTGTIGGYEGTIEANVIVKPDVLAVESVTALNAKQVLVVFNREVDKTSAETATNYEIYDNGSTTAIAQPYTAVLQDDNRSVLIIIDNTVTTKKLNNLSTAKVVVKTGVKDTSGVALAAQYTNDSVAVSDTERPYVSKIVQTAPDKIKVYFNESIYDVSRASTTLVDGNNFKIDNGSYIISANGALDLKENSIELTISGTLANGDHTLKVNPIDASDLIDFAGFEVALGAETPFTITGDSEIPTVTVKTATQSIITYKFSEPIKNANNINVLYRHSLNSNQYEVNGTSANVVVSSDNTEVTIDYKTAGKPLPAGTANLFISYTSDTGTKIQDNFNNNLPATSLTAEVVADSTKPTVTAALVSGSNTQIDVTASEPVTGGTTAANYTLKDASGTSVPFAISNPSTNVYRLTTTSAMSGVYTLTVANLKDKAIVENTMDSYSTTITVADTIKPQIANESNVATAPGFYYKQDDPVAPKTCRIYFTESMNTTDLATLTMYQDSGTSKNPTSATPASDGKSVYLVFESTIVGPVLVGQMRDAVGNSMAAMNTSLNAANATNVGLNTSITNNVVATSTKSINVYLNDILGERNATDIEVDPGTGVWTNGTLTTDNSSGKSVLTITLATAMDSEDISIFAPKVRTVSTPGTQGPAAGTKNLYEVKLNILSTSVKDNVVPELAAAANNPILTMDADGDGHIDHIKLTFAEKIAAGSVSADKFTVTGYTVKDAYTSSTAPTATDRTGTTIVDSKTVYVRVDELTSGDTGATPNVAIATGITDVNGNAYAGLAATAANDGASPALLSAVTTIGGTGLTLTFSENVSSVSGSFSAPVIGDFTYTDNGTGAASMTVTANTVYSSTVTCTLNTAALAGDVDTNTGDTVATNANQIYDATGNVAGIKTVKLSV